MAQIDIRDDYTKIYRWFGMCVEYYENLEDEDGSNQKLAKQMRDNPNDPLESLVQMRLSHMTYMMRSPDFENLQQVRVRRKDIDKMMKSFAPIEKNDWWPVWMEYLRKMKDEEWNLMWLDVDYTIKRMLKSDSGK